MTTQITPSSISENFAYDSETGIFYRLSNSKRWKAGERSGWMNKDGYRVLYFCGRYVYEHIAAWMIFYGEKPSCKIDHKNRVRDDNRISNLRLATDNENCANQSIRSDNSSGIKGVTWNKRKGKWQAQIQYKGIRKTAYFSDKKEAASFYMRCAKEMSDYFTNGEKYDK